MHNPKLVTCFEIAGSVLAIAYVLLLASNTGNERLGFSLLLISAGFFAVWAFTDKRWVFLFLQFIYGISALIGLAQWSS